MFGVDPVTLFLDSRIETCRRHLRVARITASEEIRKMALAKAFKAYEEIQSLDEETRLIMLIVVSLKAKGGQLWVLSNSERDHLLQFGYQELKIPVLVQRPLTGSQLLPGA